MLASLLLALFGGEDAAQVYNDLQRRLDAMPCIAVKTHPFFNSFDTADLEYRYLRPGKASIGGTYLQWRTDGKRTSRRDIEGRFNRPVQTGDLKTADLLGFESWTSLLPKPIPSGKTRLSSIGGRDYIALDLTISGKGVQVLFLDPKTRLPVGNGTKEEAGDECGTIYAVRPDIVPKAADFDVVAPQPASAVYHRLRQKLVKARAVSFVIEPNFGEVRAMKPDLYYRSGAGKHPSKRKAWPPEFMPGWEAFFGPKPVAQVSGTAEVVILDSGEAFAFRAIYPSRGEYRLYINAATGLPAGYDALVKGKPVAKRRFDGWDINDPEMTRKSFPP